MPKTDDVSKEVTAALFSDGDKVLLAHALEVYKQTVVRARAKELPGSGIFNARSEQIKDVERIISMVR